MSTTQTDVYNDYQQQVYESFVTFCEEAGVDEVRHLLREYQEDDRISVETVRRCLDHYDALADLYLEYSE